MDLLTRRVLFLIFTIAIIMLFFYAGSSLMWSKMFSPGPLSYAHEKLDKSGECDSCHIKGKRLDKSRCLDCHPEIRTKIQDKSGLHARVTTECTECHSEHHGRSYNVGQLDIKTFDHAKTGWLLEGKHTLLKCEACHTNDSYLLNKKECIQCHQDVHDGENGKDCSECHTPTTTFQETK